MMLFPDRRMNAPGRFRVAIDSACDSPIDLIEICGRSFERRSCSLINTGGENLELNLR